MGMAAKEKFSKERFASLEKEKVIDTSQFFEKIRQTVEQVLSRQSQMTINIAGQSAAGKSVIAEQVAQMFGESASVITMDNYLLGWDVGPLNHDSGIPDKPYFAGLNPQVYDLERLRLHLEKIHDEQEVEMPWYDEVKKGRGGFTQFSPSPLLIIDGIYALDEEFRSYADLAVLVEAPLHDRLIRKIFRNSTEYLEPVDSIIKTYLTRDEPAYSYHVDRLTAAADWVVLNPIKPSKEFSFNGTKYPVPSNGRRFIAVPKPGNGKLRVTEEISIVNTNKEIFIDYSVDGTPLFCAPVDQTTLKLISDYYEIKEN